MKFIHLHLHSHYSLLDGLPKIDEILDYTKKLKMDSVAITDHGNLYGAVEFYKKAKQKGIKPIIGCEVYQAFNKIEQKRPNIDNKRYHLVLLVKNEEGYKNLVKLITEAHLKGFYYKPRIDEDLLKKHSSGLIASSACLQGKIPRLIIANKIEEAKKAALKYQAIFGPDNFYLEIQHHPNIKEQGKVNKALIKLSKELGIPLVATCDVHYLKPEDADAQDILMMINTGADPNDPERLTMKTDDFSMRSQEEMKKFFKEVPEAIENTQKIASRCNFQFKLGETKLPYFEVPPGETPDSYLRKLCQEGLKERYGRFSQKEAIDRMNYELAVIEQIGFTSYFLIVQDFVNWAKQNRIVVGPGRGSAAGSLVAYLLNITNVDPLKYNLLFERFLNKDRISLPDIDLDFTDRRRDEVINYVAQKYGRNKVAQIITFGTMAARAVIRDVGRAQSLPYSFCDRIAKTIPFGFTLDQTLEKIPEFRQIYETEEKARDLIDFAKKLEGCARHASTHACGIVISKEPLEEIVPLQHPAQDEKVIVTQYEMHSIESLGLLKMDLLGLKNLTIIEDTLARIYKVQNKKINIENIPSDDKKTYQLFQKGETKGVFQLESEGMRRYLKQLKPTKFEDIIAMVALYRPGPMGIIPEYIQRKHNLKKVEYLHPKLEPILSSTYGLPVYQEQIMQIAQQLAGFSLSEADILRKAVGKKIRELLLAQKEKFIEGMKKNDIKNQVAQKIWNWIEPAARYSFNKCVTGDTEIVNTKTGEILRIEEIHKKQGTLPSVLSSDSNLKLKKSKTKKIFFNGVKPVYEVETQLGRKIKVTLNHPFLTINGWKILKNLKKGNQIAVPRILPLGNKKLYPIEKYRLIVLGYILAEGNTCHPHGFYFFSNDERERKDFLKALEKFQNTKGKIDTNRKGTPSIYAGRINLKKKSEAVEWIENIGLKYKKAVQKEFPSFTFRLNKEQLSLLLGKLFQGDGCINLKRKNPQIFYATSSLKLAHQLQHLLLRLGIVAKLHRKRFKYRGGVKRGYTLNISRYEDIKKFIDTIGKYLIGTDKETINRILKTHPILTSRLKKNAPRGSKDIVPSKIRNLVVAEIKRKYPSLKEFAKRNKIAYRLFFKDRRKKGYLRETLELIGKLINSQAILKYACSDMYWDTIIKIKYAGKMPTFDLNINPSHNYVANDIVIHNSHATAYATIAYQTAFLKALFPVEFMAALLTSEKNDTERISELIAECKKMEIEVLSPDINESFRNFSVIPKQNKIRFGLLAIKNVGQNVVESIITERKEKGPFKSISDFSSRISYGVLNKKSLESLIKAGVLDRLEERNKLLSNVEKILSVNREIQRNNNNNQKNLFGDLFHSSSILNLEEARPATDQERLTWEKELLGLYVSSHPLENFKKVFAQRTFPIKEINERILGQRIKIGGIISKIKKIITRNGKPMLFIKLEDLTDKIEVVVFPNMIEQNPTAFQENKIVMITGKVDIIEMKLLK